jgi:hypothetical protein
VQSIITTIGKNIMLKNQNLRIENIRSAIVNGKRVKIFNAYIKQGNAFIFAGQHSAPIKTSNKNLWMTLSV